MIHVFVVFGRFFDIVRQHDGGPYTVMQANTTISDKEFPFEENHGAALRVIFDLADPNASHAIISTGQSGNVLSRHYDDLADLWSNGEWILLPMTKDAVDAAAQDRLILTSPEP